MGFLSVIINNLDIKSVTILPLEANSPLIVDPNAVLSRPVSAQSFQSVGRWYQQVLKCFGAMEIKEFTPDYLLNRLEAENRPIIEQ